MSVNLCYTQKVREFQQEKVKCSKESIEIRLKCTKHHCPYCGSTAVSVEPIYVATCRGANSFRNAFCLASSRKPLTTFNSKCDGKAGHYPTMLPHAYAPQILFGGEIVL